MANQTYSTNKPRLGETEPAAILSCLGAESVCVLGIKPWKRWQIDLFLAGGGRRIFYANSASTALKHQHRNGGVIAVWAAREPEHLAEATAAQKSPLIRIEDGFLRSTGLGANHIGGASLVVDPDGIYFDARRPSRLEHLLQSGIIDVSCIVRAEQLRGFLIEHDVTKYNVGHRSQWIPGARDRRIVLVPGQVEDDASLRFGSPMVHCNIELLQRVREAEPRAWIVYKPHPDVDAHARVGQIDDTQILRLADEIVRDISTTSLFPRLDAVHTMTSLTGFEALLRGVPVTTWGQPFYAGWGLTDDRVPIARRTRRVSLDELVACTLLHYPLYADLDRGGHCSAEAVARRLGNSSPALPAHQRSVWRRYMRLGHGLLRSWKSSLGTA